MKTAVTTLLCLLLYQTSKLSADEPKLEAQQVNIFIEMQIVSLPRETAMPLVRDLMDNAKIEQAYAQIQDLLAHGTAKLVGWPMLTTQSGQRAVIEGIDEFCYATEYATGGLGVYVSEAGVPAEGKLKELPSKIEGTEFNAVPTAFQTRNIGVTLEVEPVLFPDGKTIEMSLVPQHVRLVGMKKASIERESTKEKISVEQPEFDTKKVTTTLTLKSGRRILLGVYPTEELHDHLELFILKAEVRKVE